MTNKAGLEKPFGARSEEYLLGRGGVVEEITKVRCPGSGVGAEIRGNLTLKGGRKKKRGGIYRFDRVVFQIGICGGMGCLSEEFSERFYIA